MSADNQAVARHIRVLTSVKRRLPQLRAAFRVHMARKDLTRLADLYNTDKGWAHGYMSHYATHLSRRRRQILNLLEIGIGRGGSLKMWHTYFPNATIYGMDLRARDFASPRIRIMHGDQGDTEHLLRVGNAIGAIDVLIDDGSHINAHVRSTFQTLFPYVTPGGCYIIEDLHTAYRSNFGGHAPGTGTSETSIGLVKELVDGLHHRHYGLSEYAPSYTDENVAAVHVYEKIVFIEKQGAST